MNDTVPAVAWRVKKKGGVATNWHEATILSFSGKFCSIILFFYKLSLSQLLYLDSHTLPQYFVTSELGRSRRTRLAGRSRLYVYPTITARIIVKYLYPVHYFSVC